MKVIIQKPDLDTCLTAMVLGIEGTEDIMVSRGEAPAEALNDPAVVCIEAGGSGQVQLNNFDHHNTPSYFSPACRQALEQRSVRDVKVQRLVDYVCMVDE